MGWGKLCFYEPLGTRERNKKDPLGEASYKNKTKHMVSDNEKCSTVDLEPLGFVFVIMR